MNETSVFIEIPKEVLQDVARQLGTNSAAHKVLELGNAEQRKGYDVRYSYDPSGPFYRVHRSLTTRMIYAMPLGRAWRLLQHVLVK